MARFLLGGAWIVGALVAAGCLFSAWVGSESFGGRSAPFQPVEVVALVAGAGLALAIPLLLWAWLLPQQLTRRTLLALLTGLAVCVIAFALLLGVS